MFEEDIKTKLMAALQKRGIAYKECEAFNREYTKLWVSVEIDGDTYAFSFSIPLRATQDEINYGIEELISYYDDYIKEKSQNNTTK